MAIRATVRRSLPRSTLRLAQARLLARLPPPPTAVVGLHAAGSKPAAGPSKRSTSSQSTEGSPDAGPITAEPASRARSRLSSSDRPGSQEPDAGLAATSDSHVAASLGSQTDHAGPSRAAYSPFRARPSSSASEPRPAQRSSAHSSPSSSSSSSTTAKDQQRGFLDIDFGVDFEALGIDPSTIPLNPFAPATRPSSSEEGSFGVNAPAPLKFGQPQRRKRIDDWSIFGSAVQRPPAPTPDPPRTSTRPDQETVPARQEVATTSKPAASPIVESNSPISQISLSSSAASPTEVRESPSLEPPFWKTKTPNTSDRTREAAMTSPSPAQLGRPPQRSTLIVKSAPTAMVDASVTFPSEPSTGLPQAASFGSQSSSTKAAGKERKQLPSSSAAYSYPSRPEPGKVVPPAPRPGQAAPASLRAPISATVSASASKPVQRREKTRVGVSGSSRKSSVPWSLVIDEEGNAKSQIRRKPKTALVRILDLEAAIPPFPSGSNAEAAQTLLSRQQATFATWLVRGTHELSRAFATGGPSITVHGQHELRLYMPRRPGADFATACRLAEAINSLVSEVSQILRDRFPVEELEPPQKFFDGRVLRDMQQIRQESIPLRPSSAPAAYVEIIDRLLSSLSAPRTPSPPRRTPSAAPHLGTPRPQLQGRQAGPLKTRSHQQHSGPGSPASAQATDSGVLDRQSLQEEVPAGSTSAASFVTKAAPPPPAAFSAAAAAAVHQRERQEPVISSAAHSVKLPDGRLLVDSPWGLEVVRPMDASSAAVPGGAPVWRGWAMLRARHEAPT